MLGGTFGGIVYNSDLDNYLTEKGKFGTNDLVIYNPLSSEYAGFYVPISDGKFTAAGLLYSWVEEVFGEGLNVLTGGAFTSDTDALMNNGIVTGAADMNVKVLKMVLYL